MSVSRLVRSLARLCRCHKGTTAVEFAIIAVPFFALILAILNTGLVFLAREALQTATSQAARLIMTGQAQNISAAEFQQDVCANTTALFTCSGIYVNVQKFSSFSSMTQLSPISNGAFNSSALSFNTGGPGDIMLVQTFYQWSVLPPFLGLNLANMNGNNLLLVGTAVFRNEPW